MVLRVPGQICIPTDLLLIIKSSNRFPHSKHKTRAKKITNKPLFNHTISCICLTNHTRRKNLWNMRNLIAVAPLSLANCLIHIKKQMEMYKGATECELKSQSMYLSVLFESAEFCSVFLTSFPLQNHRKSFWFMNWDANAND